MGCEMGGRRIDQLLAFESSCTSEGKLYCCHRRRRAWIRTSDEMVGHVELGWTIFGKYMGDWGMV